MPDKLLVISQMLFDQLK